MSFLLGVDAGQTVTKAVLFDASGTAVAAARADVEVTLPRPGWQERDMHAAWRQTASAIAACLRDGSVAARDVAAVGICGHGDGVYPVDAAGVPVRQAILATDVRATSYVDRYRGDGTAEKALPLTGQSPFAGSPASVLPWLRDHEPGVLEQARWLLHCKDWLRLCLTGAGLSGEVATDLTDGSASFTDVHSHAYAAAALALYDLRGIAGKLPPLRSPTDIAGRVSARAAAETGLAEGTPVAVGAHDVHASALGMGAVHPGAVSIIMGTFSINQVVSGDVRLDHRWQARTFLDGASWLHMSTSPTSASNFDWAVRLLGPHTDAGAPDFGSAVAEGFTVAPDHAPLFLPLLHAEAGAAFDGIRAGHGRPELLRAVLDGVVFGHRAHLDALRTRFDLGPARLAGGGARSPQWSQLLADAAGIAVEVTDTEEAGARGAAALAGLAVGWYSDLAEAAGAVARVTRRHEPHPSSVLEDRYRRYLAVLDRRD